MSDQHAILEDVHARLIKIVEEVDEFLPRIPDSPPHHEGICSSEVRDIIKARRLRDHYFEPRFFGDPAWDMLLDLYAAALGYEKVSVSSLCLASAVPQTTALRWVGVLTKAGLIERRKDDKDGRRYFVQLTHRAIAAMEAYFMRLKPHNNRDIKTRPCYG